MKKLHVLFAILLLSQICYSQSKITAEKVADKIEFRIDGSLFTNYIISENEKYPFFFPVNAPSGAGVTSMRNGNYPHHSSLFFGCDKVNGGNFWQEGLDRGQILSLRIDIIESGNETAIIENECIWMRPGATSPIRDIRKIIVSAPSDKQRIIDFEIELEMLEDVEILKTNHSLFSARIDPDLTPVFGGIMKNANAEKGEKATFGKKSPWMDCYGNRGNLIEGIAVLQHPSNPWFPSEWFTRDYGFISPTPMYWPENGKSNKFKKGEKLKLSYRVIVHSGNTEETGIDQEFENYKNLNK